MDPIVSLIQMKCRGLSNSLAAVGRVRASWLLGVLVIGLAGPGAYADELTCAEAFSGQQKVETSKTHVALQEAELRAQIEELKAKFLQPPTRRWAVSTDSGRRLYNSLTRIMARIQSRSYPFTYIADGTVPRLRVWAKIGDEETSAMVEQWIKRYQDFQMNRRLLIERTVFIRAQAELLEDLIKRPAQDFPIEVNVPQFIREELETDQLVFHSHEEVKQELRRIKQTEFERFDSILKKYFTNGWFLRGRYYQQAELETRLKIALSELKKFPLALRDRERRAELITKIQTVLNDPTLRSSTGSRYVEARRAFTDEIAYFRGSRELSTSAQEVLENGLWRNDLFDLGVDRERVGPISRFFRNVLIHSPKILLGLAAVMYSPEIKYDVKVLVMHETLMHEIADLPQAQFEDQSYQYLKFVYGTHQEGGLAVLNSTSKTAQEHFRELRAEHMEDLRKERLSEQAYALGLNAPATQTAISAQEFNHLMNLPEQNFAAAAKAFSAQKVPAAEQQDLYSRLASAYISLRQEPAAETETGARTLKADQILNGYLGFIAGDAEEKSEGKE